MYKLISSIFYRFKGIRRIAKKFLEKKIIGQPFYSGKIYFNAVDYSFFWVNGASCEKVDKEIQDKLLDISRNYDYFIDVGANIGIMSLSVALRNKHINVIAYDPNQQILNYLNRSVKENKLTGRVKTIAAAISDQSGKATMNFATGPYSAHLSSEGTEVDIIDFASILNDFKSKRTFFKFDIEGFEKNIVPIVIKNKNPLHKYIIEVHPKGLNGVSDPDFVVNELLRNEYTLEDMYGKRITSKAEVNDWDNVLCYI